MANKAIWRVIFNVFRAQIKNQKKKGKKNEGGIWPNDNGPKNEKDEKEKAQKKTSKKNNKKNNKKMRVKSFQ